MESIRRNHADILRQPLCQCKGSGEKVYTDNGSGGYKEIDYRERTKETQAMLLKNNNLIELNHKIKYK